MKDPCEECPYTGYGRICIAGNPCEEGAEYQGYLTGLAEGEANERGRIAKWLEWKLLCQDEPYKQRVILVLIDELKQENIERNHINA